MNGNELDAPVDEQEQLILQLAASVLGRQEFTEWVRTHLVQRKAG